MSRMISQEKKFMRATWLFLVAVTLLTTGCYWTMEQRWEAFDQRMKQEVGVKTRDYYLSEWGMPAKRQRLTDGGEVLVWEWRGYGGAQGWNKTLTFSSDGLLKDFKREYWPRD